MNTSKFKKVNTAPVPIENEVVDGVIIPYFIAEGRKVYFHDCIKNNSLLLRMKVFPPYDLPEYIKAVDPTIWSDPLYIEFVPETISLNLYKYDRSL